MRKVYFFLILFLCMGFSLKAQDIKVSGYVTSAEDGYGLPGVTIQVKGTSNGTITEIDGDYSITVGSRDTLTFSYVGYQTQNIAVNGNNGSGIYLCSGLCDVHGRRFSCFCHKEKS